MGDEPPVSSFDLTAYYLAVGKNISTARRAAGMTQADLGRIMKLSRGSIAKIETGTQRHLAHTLTQFAVALGVRTDDLLPQEYRSSLKAKAAPISNATKGEINETFLLIDKAASILKRLRRRKGGPSGQPEA